MDEEFLNDFVGLKTGGTTASVLKKTRSGESLPRVKTAASSSPGRDGDSRSAAASTSSTSPRAERAGGSAASDRAGSAAGGLTSLFLKEAAARDASAADASDEDTSPAHAAALARDRATAKAAERAKSAAPGPAASADAGRLARNHPEDPDAHERRRGRSQSERTTRREVADDADDARLVSTRPASAGSRSSRSGDEGSAAASPTLSVSAPTSFGSLMNGEGDDARVGGDVERRRSEPETGTVRASETASPSSSRPSSRPNSGGARSAERLQRNTSSFVLDAESNPTPQSIPPPVFGDQGNIGEKHVLVMVGLPARGKTHMAKRLCQYLRFFHGARTQVFNVGSYRRRMMPKKADSKFFDQKDERSEALRKSFARAALKDMIDFLFQEDNASYLEQRGADSGRVAIFDATNTTRARREWIREQLDRLPLKLLFVESVCTDEAIIDRNIWQAKVNNEDYRTEADKRRAFEDFKDRIRKYEEVYEPMQEEHLSFIKLINQGRRVEINNIHGFLLGRIVQFLSNLHAKHQTIYLSRHGQSEYNFQGKIGGDSVLSRMGEKYATRLAEYCERTLCVEPDTEEPRPCRLWTSSLQRTIMTARHIKHPKIKHPNGRDWVQMSPRVLRNLDEIYAGVCDGMTYEEIEANYPEEFALRRENKLGYRYPRGESYLDVISRLDPLIQELESYQEPVLIVGHQGVLRLIYAYFMGMDRADACTASIPLNTVIKLTPLTHTCEEERDVLYEPSKDDLGAVTEEGDAAGGGVSPTQVANLAHAEGNPFAMNTEPPSY